MNYLLTLIVSTFFPPEKSVGIFGRAFLKTCGEMKFTYGNIKLNVSPYSLLDRFIILGLNINPFFLSAVRQYGVGGIVIDIGANHGVLSLLSIKNGAAFCISIEPSVRECAKLLKNMELNGETNFGLINCALGAKSSGITDFYISNAINSGKNSMHFPNALEATKCRVFTAKFDDIFCASQVVNDLRVVKIDCEGAELDILKGMELSIKKMSHVVFIVEISPSLCAGGEVEQIYTWFTSRGFVGYYKDDNISADKEEVFYNPKINQVPRFSPYLLIDSI